MTARDDFLELVLRWVREHGEPMAKVITDVRGEGGDWYGSTEGGFYDHFEVDIRGDRENGSHFHDVVIGERMVSLWRFVTAEP